MNDFILAAAPYVTAFIAGVFGGVHCVGMCGGVLGALVYGLPQSVRAQTRTLGLYVAAYNVGRITTYVIAGGIAGFLGVYAADWVAAYRSWFFLRIAAAALMIALGLYLAGCWMGLAHVERAGAVIWRRLEPLGRRLLPIRRPLQAWLLGLLWGWLPCGLVYTVLIWSLASGGWLEGALLMATFGAGTLPLLMTLGLSAVAFTRLLRHRVLRGAAGAIVGLCGIWTLAATLASRTNVGLGHMH